MMKHYLDPATGELFAFEADGSQDAFIAEGLVPLTNEEANAVRAQNAQSAWNALDYAEKRAIAYPSIADQLDLLYHGGYDAWKAQIAAVKEEYPKP